MSYGVLASKSGHLSLDDVVVRGGRAVPPDDVDRFRTVWGGAPVQGRLTVTRLHLTFVPHSITKGVRMMELSVADLTGVELSGGMVSKIITLRVPRHALRFRCIGAQSLAHQIAVAIEANAEGARHAPHR